MNVLIDGVILSAILYGICAWGIRNGAVNMVFLYDQNVKDRVVEMGLTTHEKIRAGKKKFASLGLLYAHLRVRHQRHARGCAQFFAGYRHFVNYGRV